MKFKLNELLLAFLCLSFIGVNAQSYNKLSNSLDLVIGADFGYRTINMDPAFGEFLFQQENRAKLERPQANYRIGLNYIQGLSSSWALKTGIRYATAGFNISSVEAFDISQDINLIDKNFSVLGSDYKYNYRFIEIPVGLRYVFNKSFCDPFIEFGIATNIYQHTQIFQDGNRELTKKESINKFNYFGYLSLGGDFEINDRLRGFTQLMGRYQFNKLRKGPLEERAVSLGLETGLRFHF